ncbi:hypothetical protein B0A55_10615 [Friedmanniomyces simplex]|uniref:Uncharacterized protein n=1 Tax=Friedmanniomyces simplex TaxID=329884 RepID=A0A4U0WL29_9PEZI|nr:hypothetical protein B0A55_10615 [Friedmanniomyces simplex]
MPPRKKQFVEAKLATSSTASPGFKLWASGTKLFSGESLTKAVSQWRVNTGSLTQSVEVRHIELFTLKPLVITEGAYKGRHVLMLQPVTITDYFRFMDLPPELRKMVYDLVLLEKSEKITIESYKPVGQPRRPVRQGFRYTGRNDHRGMTWDKTRGKWIGQLPSNLGVLRALYKARKNDDTAVSVFDIIKLPESEVCRQCKYNKEHASYRCRNMACGYPCAEQEEHYKAFAPKLRAAIANQLGITRFLADGSVGE